MKTSTLLLLIAVAMFVLGGAVFAYAGDPLPYIIVQAGELSFFAWPFVLIAALIASVRGK